MRNLINRLPVPQIVKHWLLIPLWCAIVRLSKPEVRIVTGGISFYALFSIFPLIYLTETLLFTLLPADVSQQLSNTIDQVLVSAVAPLSKADLDTIRSMTARTLTLQAIGAIIVVFYTASSGAKAAITGIRMVTGSERASKIIRFQGVSILMTALLILSVWILGALQLMASFITENQGFVAFELAQGLSDLASRLWLGKGIACFAIFYMIIALSLHGRIKGHRAKVAGAASGALAWMGATWAFHIYLKFSALDSFYGALASVILGFIWLSVSVASLLLGAALTAEWASRIPEEGLAAEEGENETEALA